MKEYKKCEICGKNGADFQSCFTFLDQRSYEVVKPTLHLCYDCKQEIKNRRMKGLSSPARAVEVAKRKAGLLSW